MRLPAAALLPAAVLLAATLFAAPLWSGNYGDYTGVVLHSCYDGDTCKVTIPGLPPVVGREIPIRFRGIDTPEIRGECAAEKSRALLARDRLNEVMQQAGTIALRNVERGRYFRLVADVYADGVDVAGLMLREGHARPYSGRGRRPDWCAPAAAPSPQRLSSVVLAAAGIVALVLLAAALGWRLGRRRR